MLGEGTRGGHIIGHTREGFPSAKIPAMPRLPKED